jgi:GntR family transcriptional regulator/MocR family aminotransferase
MPKIAPYLPLAGISLDRRRSTPLATQLYDALRTAILSRRLRPGIRLPSTRVLASELGVSRNTAATAYEQLATEGYLQAKVGSGTLVARSIPAENPRRAGDAAQLPIRPSRDVPSKVNRFLSGATLRPLTFSRVSLPFAAGLPETTTFPVSLWNRLMTRQLRELPGRLLTYGDPAGYLPLREAIAAHVRVSRAVTCEPEQVLVVNGSQQALDLASRVLVSRGEGVLVEDPGYPGARAVFALAGAELFPLPVDSEGGDITRVPSRARASRVAVVTPSHQFPLGVTMTVGRRLALIEWARRSESWIIEDDYDSEFRYRGKPLPSLQGLDRYGRVIYVGTFSKTLFPSLRLGFMVLPLALVDVFRSVRSALDAHSPVIEQGVLASFVAEGHYARHVRRMRILYQERQSILIEAAARELQGLLRLDGTDGGMHLVGWLPRRVNDVDATNHAKSWGVIASPLSLCTMGPRPDTGLLLGYAPYGRDEICEGTKRLSRALRSM